MSYSFKTKPIERYCASEATVVHFTRFPNHIHDVDRGLVDLEGTLDDPRNWRGSRGHKEQTLVRHIIRQRNAAGGKGGGATKSQSGYGEISFAQIKELTGINPGTAQELLQGLKRRGILDVDVKDPGTRGARWFAGLRLPVSAWQVERVHTWKDPGAGSCPF